MGILEFFLDIFMLKRLKDTMEENDDSFWKFILTIIAVSIALISICIAVVVLNK